jgi:THO complex subunit 2
MLEIIGVVPSHKIFTKKAIRLNTSLLYKQQKFNLLREESEGFSMLETYLTSNLPQPPDLYFQAHKGHMSLEEITISRKEHIKELAGTMLENITSLIGYFDLNPNKVLDVILDVFVANVTDYWEFFIELLSRSYWKSKTVIKKIKRGAEEIEIHEQEGRPVCGQILGFKFDYYNHVAPPNQSTPPQLFWIAALLIRHKFVRLEDLYPHLSPADEDVAKEYEEYLKNFETKKKTAGRFQDTKVSISGLFKMKRC